MAVFARKASGLVREASLFDTAMFSFMNNALGACLWWIFTCGPYMFPGGHPLYATIITTILCIFNPVLVWGILGASMPRSGGSYVYNSRILHPLVGIAISMINAGFVMTAWIWCFAPMCVDPGIRILAGALHVPYERIQWWVETPAGLYIGGTIANILAFLAVLFGLRQYFRVQNTLLILGTLGVLIAGIFFTITPHEEFVYIWNTVAVAEYGEPSYQELIDLVWEEAPWAMAKTWNWRSTIAWIYPISWLTIYGYIIAFIGGEVKNPRRNIILGQFFGMIWCALFTAWYSVVHVRCIGYEFMHAIGYVDNEWPDWYNLELSPNYIGMACLICDYKVKSHGLRVLCDFLMGSNYLFFNWLWIPFSYIAFSRGLFAQAMDRVGPKWFTDIHPRFGQPVKLLILEFILSQIAITFWAFWPEYVAVSGIEGLQYAAVFATTSISCAIFPFRKKVRHIWEASPARDWKIGPIPLATIAGVIGVILIGICEWALFSCYAFEAFSPIWTPIWFLVGVFAVGWYYYWKRKAAEEGIDISLAYTELPPE
ncbi:hypothetical protein DRO32_04635 [Candidatus Bathyarchaeota archaeon]|nr:MAG: hypothetical protein DRO32_04635 [Candidatus Bathyarchaeota archaeon]